MSDLIRVAIADDSVLLRDGVVRLLEEYEFDVVAAVGDAGALEEAMTHIVADLIVIDVRMPPTFTDEGVQAALRIRSNNPRQAIVVLSQYVEERYAADLLTGDPSGIGYLLKDRVVDIVDFVQTLRRVAAGGSAIDAEVVAQILGRSRRTSELQRLTPREREVLAAMAEGMSNGGIADKLVISLGAVEKHIGNVFTKLQLNPEDTAHRRVLAVLAFLESRS
jgi:DNA-binding NarL/FixJ family response regulator